LGIKAVLLGSEAVYADQRESIERAFGARAFSWYGHSERMILGGECEQTAAYHQFPDYGILEIIREDGASAAEGETGELVGTGLLNRCLPLIRYRTGDLARVLPADCRCGRHFDRFDSVEGRWKQEFVIGKNGSRISMAALNVHGRELEKVLRYQYRQSVPGVVEFRMMATADFMDADLDAVLRLFARKTGDELEVRPVVVPDIPLTARGKLRRLIQEIPDLPKD
jgi:phenylacetate-CoA ligase